MWTIRIWTVLALCGGIEGADSLSAGDSRTGTLSSGQSHQYDISLSGSTVAEFDMDRRRRRRGSGNSIAERGTHGVGDRPGGSRDRVAALHPSLGR